ncbi:flagellar basal body P-ring formation chaperone FlgA [Uliginosibacterium sp. H3]|uniref:Flagella basal body P-ring formation protein FlgA n=1 Tax=Uliginosibacterium silvisoli TaxID=3114758 RepID=A0ABU6K6X1_9RHOO|nr:flagellar basal body P-ring formation chaperone FlgA [Uliginosibacterium sp. H3]
MQKSLATLLSCALFAPLPTLAMSSQDVVNTVTAFLQERTLELPGTVSLSVTPPGEHQQILQPCIQAQAFLPQGQKTWGRVTVGLRCVSGSNASLYVSARVKVEGSYVKMARPISSGQQLSASDMQIEQGELTAYPDDIVVAVGDALGQMTKQALSAGQPLRGAYLKGEAGIQAGQTVKVVASGGGFSVVNSGRALNSAARGTLIRVKLDNGKIISGIAGTGDIVDVSTER